MNGISWEVGVRSNDNSLNKRTNTFVGPVYSLRRDDQHQGVEKLTRQTDVISDTKSDDGGGGSVVDYEGE